MNLISRFVACLCLLFCAQAIIIYCAPVYAASSETTKKTVGNKNSDFTGTSYILSGSQVSLDGNTYKTIKIREDITSFSGSLELWLRPLWEDDAGSHVIFSLPWNDSRNSYMALSEGWWEPEGSNYLYFILSNQDEIGCKTSVKLTKNVWNHLVVTWNGVRKGVGASECNIYINGDKVAHYASNKYINLRSDRIFYLGSDKGTTETKGRSSDFEAKKLNIYSFKMSDREVKALYQNYFSSSAEAMNHRWSWLKEKTESTAVFKSKNSKHENRVIFDESFQWATSKEEADKILTRIKSAGFNVYVPCVWHGKGAYFPTKLVSPDERLIDIFKDGYDPLLYLIRKAHSLDIEVHPWFTVVRREEGILPEYAGDGTPDNAFDVHNPEFRKFIVDLMLDVVKRYDVDGINLDYIRSMGVCISESCKSLYYGKYQRYLNIDKLLSRIPKYQMDSIRAWNGDAVYQIVRMFSRQAKQIKPSLIVSVDAHPLNADLHLQGQESVKWANEGFIDVIFNMDYKPKINVDHIKEVQKHLKDKDKMIMLVSLYDIVDGNIVARDGDVVADYAKYFRNSKMGNGVAYYHYPRLSNEHVNTLKGSVFDSDAVTTWRNDP